MRDALMILAALSLLTACGRNEERGELTADEERQLDRAEQMLNESLIDPSPEANAALSNRH